MIASADHRRDVPADVAEGRVTYAAHASTETHNATRPLAMLLVSLWLKGEQGEHATPPDNTRGD